MYLSYNKKDNFVNFIIAFRTGFLLKNPVLSFYFTADQAPYTFFPFTVRYARIFT